MELENVIYKLQRGLDKRIQQLAISVTSGGVDSMETYIGSHIKSDLAGEPVSNESYEKYYKDLI